MGAFNSSPRKDREITAANALSFDMPLPPQRSRAAVPLRAAATINAAAEVEVLRTIDAVSAIEREWDSLYFDAEPRNAFLSHPWTLACWAAQTQAAQPFVVTVTV